MKNGIYILLLGSLVIACLLSSVKHLGSILEHSRCDASDSHNKANDLPAENKVARTLDQGKTHVSELHMVTIADEPFADRYGVYFDRMKVYAETWGYAWAVLPVENYDEDICPNIQP